MTLRAPSLSASRKLRRMKCLPDSREKKVFRYCARETKGRGWAVSSCDHHVALPADPIIVAEAGRISCWRRRMKKKKAQLLFLLFCDRSGQDLGLSGGDPPNPPRGQRGRTGYWKSGWCERSGREERASAPTASFSCASGAGWRIGRARKLSYARFAACALFDRVRSLRSRALSSLACALFARVRFLRSRANNLLLCARLRSLRSLTLASLAYARLHSLRSLALAHAGTGRPWL